MLLRSRPCAPCVRSTGTLVLRLSGALMSVTVMIFGMVGSTILKRNSRPHWRLSMGRIKSTRQAKRIREGVIAGMEAQAIIEYMTQSAGQFGSPQIDTKSLMNLMNI